MNYDGFTLAAVTAELKRLMIRSKVQKVRQHNDTDITLELRGQGYTHLLFFSVDARFSRVYLTSGSNPVPQEPPNFCMVLRKHLSGMYVAAIEQVGLDRILKIRFESHEVAPLELIFELMGKHSNLILVNDKNQILGAIKHVGSSISRFRQILPGKDYTPPPDSNKMDPRNVSATVFRRMWNAAFTDGIETGAVKKWLMDTFSGIGPFLADEITTRGTEDSVILAAKVEDEILQLGEMLRTSKFMPVLITGQRGEGVMVYPMPSVQYEPSLQHVRPSINEALDVLFRTLVTRTLLEDERTQILTAIRRVEAARKQTLKSIDRTLAESEKAERYKQIGELLIGSMDTIEKGAKSVMLVDYYDPEMPEVAIELDEKLTPQQNSERYFKRYQKSRDAVSTAQARREIAQRELSLLESAKKDAESAKDVETLKSLRKMLTDQDIFRPEIASEKQSEPEFGGARIRRYVTPDGWEILHGENSTSNDYLTQRVARPNDLWLHARSITGAHVVIRTAGHKGTVPRPVLLQAAKIAAQNSDAKHSSLVPIDYVQRKHVRKPRGSAPGYVTYRNEKTIDINPKAQLTTV